MNSLHSLNKFLKQFTLDITNSMVGKGAWPKSDPLRRKYMSSQATPNSTGSSQATTANQIPKDPGQGSASPSGQNSGKAVFFSSFRLLEKWMASQMPKIANLASPFIRKQGVGVKALRWNGTCLYLLPNLRKMDIIPGKLNSVLARFGVNWMEGQELALWGWRNRKYNKYLVSQYRRLEKAREKGTRFDKMELWSWNLRKASRWSSPNRQYWELAYFLMTRSRVFQVLHLNKSSPGWERKRDLQKDILPLLRSLNKILSEGSWNQMQIRRAWIDTNGGKRPLGIPHEAHRLIGSMMGNLLEFYLDKTIIHNHGYQYAKGSGTAWKEILSRVVKYPYIYELDLEGFFNNLSHRSIGEILRAIGLPAGLWLPLLEMQKSLPTNLQDMLKLPQLKGGIPSLVGDSVPGTKKILGYYSDHNPRGVAQGHNLSPLLSILVLDHVLQKFKAQTRAQSLFYADDGILFHYEDIDLKLFEKLLSEIGVRMSPSKSAWVRRSFNWERPLKFLGIIYDPFQERLKAATRKGSKVILERSQGVLLNWWGQEIRTEDGIFVHPEPYKLGSYTLVTRLQWRYIAELVPRTILLILTFIFLMDYPWITPILLLLFLAIRVRKYLKSPIRLLPWRRQFWWFYARGWGLFHYLVSQVWVKKHVYMITWRLVLSAGKLNQFLARLYGGSLEDKEQFANFYLTYEPGSVIHWAQNECRDWLEADLEYPITVFNSSSVGTNLLIELLADRPLNEKEFALPYPSISKLKSRVLLGLNAGGYYSIGRITTQKDFRPLSVGPDPEQYYQPERLKQRLVLRLLPILDWIDAIGARRTSFKRGDRHQLAVMYPEGEGTIRRAVSRLYDTYLVQDRYWNQKGTIYWPVMDLPDFFTTLDLSNKKWFPLSYEAQSQESQEGRYISKRGFVPVPRTQKGSGREASLTLGRVVSVHCQYPTVYASPAYSREQAVKGFADYRTYHLIEHDYPWDRKKGLRTNVPRRIRTFGQ